MNKKINGLFTNKTYIAIVKWLFPIILVAFSFVGVNRGVDCSDTGYNLGNYTYLAGLDRMWYYSTLFSNYIGWVLVRLPFGSKMLAANIYMGIIKASFGLFSYFYFTKKAGYNREAVFLADLISFGLWWIPNAGLYHYLSVYLFAISGVLLYEGLTKNNNKKLVIAGIVLALNVLVRFPNVVQAGLIVAVWWYAILNRENFKKCLVKTLYCMAGYIGTLIAVFGIIAACGNLGLYVNSIMELFQMTGDAQKYGSRFMLTNLINSYTCVWYWLIPIAFGTLILYDFGEFAAVMEKEGIPSKWVKILKTLGTVFAVAGYLAIYLWEYKTELFDYVFTSYSSIYLFAVVIMIITMGMLFFGLFYKGFDTGLRLWCMIALVIQLIIPIGSNNSLYAVMNNLFFILPVVFEAVIILGKTKHLRYAVTGFWVFIFLFAVQSVGFKSKFTFRDGFLGPVKYSIEGNEVTKGMITEEINAVSLSEMTEIWAERGLKDYSVITFGNTAGYAYFLESRPAISSTWPILDSYVKEKFKAQLDDLSVRMQEGEKVVVISDVCILDEGPKQDILKEFLQKYDFVSIYDNGNLFIWIQED